ncbi:DUF1385 domain-containing protein [Candidatus Woesearchaeota archaeon]|nr:DUF1385 domain-containing protein [Candidatus Woesearchaeota archaeon]
MDKKLEAGGQAVIEGVMIKTPRKIAIAVRKPDGKIVTKTEKNNEEDSVLANIFFIRGIYKLVYMLNKGLKALIWSGNQVYEEEEELSNKEIFFVLIASLAFSILIFNLVPYVLTSIKIKEISFPIIFNLVDGIIRIIIFILYILLITKMDDVKQLFEYHGAEHKVVNCYEQDKKLTIKNIKECSTIHARCGTQFLILLFVISIFSFSVLPPLINLLFSGFIQLHFIIQKIILFIVRLLLIPVIAGFSYEFLKFFSNRQKNILVKGIIYPGLLFQKLTTKEPNEKQIKVAIKSLKLALD